MPTPLVPNAARVTVSGQLFGQLVQNVWGVTTDGAPTALDLHNVLDIFQTAYVDIMAPLSDQFSINLITGRYLGVATGPESTLAITPAAVGGVAGASSPSNVALCVSLHSALAGRRFRGRKFFSGIPEGSTADNVIVSTLCDAIVGAINDVLVTNLEANGTPLSIISLVGLTVVPVFTAICTDFFVDSQRRRLTGRGR